MYRGYYAFGIGHYQFDMCHDSHSMGFYKNKGTQRDETDDVTGPQPTVTLWVAPTSGQRYHLKKDCGQLLCAKAKNGILLVSNVVFYENKGAQKDGIDDVIGTQPTVTLWVAPTGGQNIISTRIAESF